MQRKQIQVKKDERKSRDKIRVLARCGDEPHRSFYLTVTSLQFNGESVKLFGRLGPHGSDRSFEAREVVFRRVEDLEHFVCFEADSIVSKQQRLIRNPFAEADDAALDLIAVPLRQKVRRRLMSHPSIKINAAIFRR